MIIHQRTSDEIVLMRKSGEITAKALKKTLGVVRSGITLAELDRIAEDEILSLGGQPSFKTVPGYKWTTCITVNEEVVHGIPRERVLSNGDLVSIDLGTVYKGWHTDAAWSLIVSKEEGAENEAPRANSPRSASSGSLHPRTESPRFSRSSNNGKEKFLKVGEAALWKGIEQAIDGNRIGDISGSIQEIVEGESYSIVRALVGHGVGKSLHEEPEVPGFGVKGKGMVLRERMTIAVEVIYSMGHHDVILAPDGWTILTKDGSLGGLFEMSLVIGKNKPEVLTDWKRY